MIAVNRRKFLGAGAGGMGLLGLAGAMPAWARGADILAGNARKGLDEVSGPNIDLTVARSAFAAGNRRGGAIAVNGTIPGPLLRLQEGTTVRLNVHNQLEEDTSIHWHGLLVPFQLDGVPGLSKFFAPAGGGAVFIPSLEQLSQAVPQHPQLLS